MTQAGRPKQASLGTQLYSLLKEQHTGGLDLGGWAGGGGLDLGGCREERSSQYLKDCVQGQVNGPLEPLTGGDALGGGAVGGGGESLGAADTWKAERLGRTATIPEPRSRICFVVV